MRAMFVLAAILSFATPQLGSWSPMALAHDVSGTMSLATPAPGASSQIVRGVASKTDKTFSSGFAIAAERLAFFPAFVSIGCTLGANDAPPHLDLNAPPLAARPPPAS